MDTQIEIGSWVVKIGSSKPSSGICHQVTAIEGDILRLKCGSSMTHFEVLDIIVDPASQGRCLRCSAVITNSRRSISRMAANRSE
jgi:hypothetical protein